MNDRDPSGLALRDAVLQWIREHPDVLHPADVRRLEGSEPIRDDDGRLRLGRWILREDRDPPELVRRRKGGGAVVETVLRLRRKGEDGWTVLDHGERRHRPRRR